MPARDPNIALPALVARSTTRVEEKVDGYRMGAWKRTATACGSSAATPRATHGRFPGIVAALRSLDVGSGVIWSAH